MGAAGAALATVLAEGIIACIQIHYVWNEVADILKSLPYLKFLVSNCAATAVLLAYKKWLSFPYTLFALMVACILFFGIYGLTLILLKDELVCKYGIYYIKKVMRRRNLHN